MDVITFPDDYKMVDVIHEYVDDNKFLELGRAMFYNKPSIRELPDTTDQKLCYKKLLERLATIQMELHQVVGVGDCYFRSLSHQIHNTEEYHPFYRALTAAYMRDNQASFDAAFRKEFPFKSYDQYCDEVARLRTPVGEIPILASCEALGIKIIRVFSYGTRVVEILVPRSNVFTKEVFISFIYGHADSIFPIGTKPPPLLLPLSTERLEELKTGGFFTPKDHRRNMRFAL